MSLTASAPGRRFAVAVPSLTIETVFAHAVCVSCLILQRFGATLGSGSQLAVSLIIVPAAIAVLVLTGKVEVNRSATVLFVLTAISTLFTTFLTILYPDFAYRFSLLSFYELGILYLFLILRPSKTFDNSPILSVFTFWARIVAACALLQYALQFAHIKLFSFTDMHVPAAILLESAYHVVAPIAYGSPILRSNGFFLLEPSLLSQIMALACLVDGFVLRRYRFLPLYGAALLSAFSGTGLLVLVGSVLFAGLLSPRQIPRVLIFSIVAALVVAAVALVFPNQFATLAARANGNDASAQMRYGEQINVLGTVGSDQRLLLGFGPGAADGFVRLGSLSPALKLVFDYGVLGTTVFFIFLLVAWWRVDHPILSLGALIAFQFGGGNLLFPPLVFLLTYVCVWSRPAVSPATSAAASRFPWSRTSGVTAPL